MELNGREQGRRRAEEVVAHVAGRRAAWPARNRLRRPLPAGCRVVTQPPGTHPPASSEAPQPRTAGCAPPASHAPPAVGPAGLQPRVGIAAARVKVAGCANRAACTAGGWPPASRLSWVTHEVQNRARTAPECGVVEPLQRGLPLSFWLPPHQGPAAAGMAAAGPLTRVVLAVPRPQGLRLGQPGARQAQPLPEELLFLLVLAPLVHVRHQQLSHHLGAADGAKTQ